MKILFAGTPDFAAVCLAALLDSHHTIQAVYTQPDRKAGRGQKLQASAVKQLALDHQLPVCQPEQLKTPEVLEALKAWQADIAVVVAYGLLLPQAALDVFPLGCINVHASLLPRWRGAAPIQRAIEAGDKETGVSIMQMDQGMDTGAVLLQKTLPIHANVTSEQLFAELAELGAMGLLETLQLLEQDKAIAVPQSAEGVCYAKKISKEEGLINWNLPAQTILNKIRAFNSYPIAYTILNQQVVRVWQAELSLLHSSKEPGTIFHYDKNHIHVATGEKSIALTQLQLAGGKSLTAADMLNARQELFSVGQQFQDNTL